MKVAIVTGAAQGIGRRTSEVLAGAGYAVAVLDVQSCAATLAAIRAVGVAAEEVLGDICEEAVVAQAVKTVLTRWGRADLLVNNAGVSLIEPAETTEGRMFQRVLEVNLLAPFLLARGLERSCLNNIAGAS
jgi:NAD(P)-dependent dehydrogenase (short-subunit alcohol dehydrogenase family)